jgi:hypothetical protein
MTRELHRTVLLLATMLFGGGDAMAIEEAKYTVAAKEDNFEIRDYAPHVVAEILVEGDLESAGSKAFSSLFRYISGNNRRQDKVAMTAPVSQEPGGEKIEMTTPVGQQGIEESWVVSFMMPASRTLETLPEPLDPRVTLRQVPARRLAAVRYSGFWSEEGYLRNRAALESWMENRGLRAAGEPIWARYNSPFSLWFLRRNEVLIPIASAVGAGAE